VRVSRPIWYLNVICPWCQGEHPILISCPTCEYVAAACDNVGGVFLNPKDLMGSRSMGDSEKCPSCGTSTLEDFAPANSEQIRRAGLDGMYF
jgi:hypothetical protein